ncbi:hypothetical protein SAMN00120144_3162 [Hymenobacter roseosalivarius DSM 11622]|uniref:Peptidase M10 metallopeptidase domain-containing protein n=1 Tax=Hymenobacter roseosalivarius DSM 11622 TaxID=645990 RepID=A0A1W1UVF0_9BACT|nr:matrixin family metalloprotease [Hymenobacter roseosalivarius]SMB85063.1 hypothetical protein SAMN00120144_3162 [Hymenobacter roseosalivarius DSM 11622]
MKVLSSLQLALGLVFSVVITPAFAQTVSVEPESHCLMLPLDPTSRAQASALVVEGEVLDARSFWDTSHRRIYTAHRVRVFKVFKGAAAAELTVITEGGTVELKRQELTNTLRLFPGEQGVLFLYPAPFAGIEAAGQAWTAYGSEQGFIRYDLTKASASEPFRQYPLVGQNFYADLKLTTGQPTLEVAANPVLTAVQAQRTRPAVAAKGTAPIVAGLSPLTIAAGINAVLTITGTGFGATRGTGFVSFLNADDGGETQTRAQTADYISWTDTRIQVRVPSNGNVPGLPDGTIPARTAPAGTGPVRVTTAEQLEGISGIPLTVIYAVSNVETQGTNEIVRPGHINQNSKGGYTLRFDSSLAGNAAAVAAFRRALATWRCQTGMNWEVGANSTKRGAEENDENVIGFDFGTGESQLPARVLGRTTSYYEGCRISSGPVYFWVSEIDMQLDTETSWQFGPGNPSASQIDFESVIVHELGHAHQLSHVIAPAAVMHYAVARGRQNRQINPASDIIGGRLLLRTRSFVPPACGSVSPMLPAPLISVDANALAGIGSQVNWTTQDECFLREFVIERAADTTAWQPLATVQPGSAGGQYTYVDPTPLPGRSFYRLRVRRPDNSLDNTLPQAVTALAGGPVKEGLQLFPNPLDEGPASLLYIGAATGQLTLDIYDAVGRRRRTEQVNYQSGRPFFLNLTDLRSGWYIVRWRDQTGKTGSLNFVRSTNE